MEDRLRGATVEPELANLPTGFLQAIRDRPDDDAPRLIAADYLDENGHPEYAKYIRISCELERVPFDRTSLVKEVPWDCHKSTPVADFRLLYKLHRRSDLLQVNEAQWLAHTPLFKQVSSSGGSAWVPSFEHVWHRGFVRTVRCTLADWQKYGPEILRSQPVLEVVTEKRPRGVSDRFYWWDYGRWPGTNIENEDVPEDVFALLGDFLHDDGADVGCRIYPSEEAAMTALSAALIAWALTQADKVS